MVLRGSSGYAPMHRSGTDVARIIVPGVPVGMDSDPTHIPVLLPRDNRMTWYKPRMPHAHATKWPVLPTACVVLATAHATTLLPYAANQPTLVRSVPQA
eukprot:179810-Rhodomonas_salina.1